jgi:hypothetical protein
VRRSTAALAAPAALCVLLFSAASPAQRPMHGAHPNSNTAGSNLAGIFSPANEPATQAFFTYVGNRLIEQHYNPTRYFDTDVTDDLPGTATAHNFKQLSGRGTVVVVTHGSGGELLVESYRTAGARDAALAGYLSSGEFAPPELTACAFDHADQRFLHLLRINGICITAAGIRSHFADDDSIVHVGSCDSKDLSDDFAAREYFGYDGCPTFRTMADDGALAWGRMHGAVDSGMRRPASAAFGGGGFSAGFAYLHEAGKIDTVLSPAVRAFSPAAGSSFSVGGPYAGFVEFDTAMNTQIEPRDVVLSDDGCMAINKGESEWVSPRRLTFQFNVERAGSGRFTVRAQSALADPAAGFANVLDGNAIPPGTEHVGPNADSHFVTITCTAAPGAPRR